MNYLIIGGSGFIGKELTKKLIEKYGKNNNFTLLSRRGSFDFLCDIDRSDVSIKIVKGDVANFDSIEKYFKNTDYVFHLAAILKYGNYDETEFRKINIEGSSNVFKLAIKYKIKKVINLSSAGIFHPTGANEVDEFTKIELNHNTKYTHSKYLAHLTSTKFIEMGANIINILPVSVFGDSSPMFNPMIDQVINNSVLLIPKLEFKLSLVYIDDLVNGIVRAFESGKIGDSYIFSGTALSVKQLYQKVAKILNKKIIIIEFPNILSKPIFTIFDLASRVMGKNFYFNREMYNYVNGGLVAKHDRAIKVLGHVETDFDNNFSKMVLSHVAK